MKILFCARSDLFRVPGGDTLQTEMYVKYLRQKGLVCDVTTEFCGFPLDYDVFHIMNLDRPLEGFFQSRYIRKRRRDAFILLMTIHHSRELMLRFNKYARGDWIGALYRITGSHNTMEFLKNMYRIMALKKGVVEKARIAAAQRFPSISQQARMLADSDALILHTEYERDIIENDLRTTLGRNVHFLDNGVDETEFSRVPDLETKDGILCVGRIEPRKNQLKLLEILAGTDYRVTFIGRPNPNDTRYFENFRQRLKGVRNAAYVPGMPHGQLVEALMKARLHVSASFVEVSPLIDLEALAAGCNVIATSNSSVYGQFAFRNIMYARQEDLDLATIERMYHEECTYEARSQILSDFTWERVAERLSSIYREAYRQRGPCRDGEVDPQRRRERPLRESDGCASARRDGGSWGTAGGSRIMPGSATFTLGPVSCSPHTIAQQVDEIRLLLGDRRLQPRTLLCLNAHIYNMAHTDPRLREVLNEARIVSADGMSIVWASRLFGVKLAGRCNATEAFRTFLVTEDMPRNEGFLVGCSEEEARAAAVRIEQMSKHCRITEAVSGYLDPPLYRRVFATRREVDFIFLGMGTPRTEMISRIAATICPGSIVWGIGGGTIRIFAGTMREAPAFWRRNGLQWLYRLCQDPRQLWRRYTIGNLLFMLRIARARLQLALDPPQPYDVPGENHDQAL